MSGVEMSGVEMLTLLRDSLQGTEASAWQKAALELNRRLVFAQIEATAALVKATKATTIATYVLAAATTIVAAFSIIKAFSAWFVSGTFCAADTTLQLGLRGTISASCGAGKELLRLRIIALT